MMIRQYRYKVLFIIMAALLMFQVSLGPPAPPTKVIDFSNYHETSAKFGEKKVNKLDLNNSTTIGNVYETLTNKVKVEEKPTVIEAPLKVVKKDQPKKIVKKEEPKKPVIKPVEKVQKPKPAETKPKPNSSFKVQVESHIDSIEAALSGLTHEMAVASSAWFEVQPFDDLGLTD
jgi:outer membrane biosynthesis protein TonB